MTVPRADLVLAGAPRRTCVHKIMPSRPPRPDVVHLVTLGRPTLHKIADERVDR